MSSRVYFAPQAGRQGKTGVKDEEEWGKTTNQAEFRGYEPAEMRNCRDGPLHTKTCHETSSRRGTQPKKASPTYNWYRSQEHFPAMSACTASEQSMSRSYSSGNVKDARKAEKPSWATVHERPIPHRPFDAESTYKLHQEHAQQARHAHFPYRDEFAPRSKRLLYELAHQRVSRDSVASGSTADSASAFTMASSRHSAAQSAARSKSEGSLVASSHHTASSSRLPGRIARRRWEAQYRSPALWPPDREWLDEKLAQDGMAGLTFANFPRHHYTNTFRQQVEQRNSIAPITGGYRESELVA